MEQLAKHILLSSMGIWPQGKERQTLSYNLGEEKKTSYFSAFGLWQLLNEADRPTEIWFLLTPKARATQWTEIQNEASRLHIAVKAIDLSADMDDTREFLEQTASAIPEGTALTLNVTEGLRHHAFLFYALALYLTTFRQVKIVGAWYCRMETDNPDDPKPLIDLKPTLDLAHWFHALAVFRETGSLRVLARLTGNKEMTNALESFSSFFLTGMPIEAGDQATRLLAQMSPDGSSLPDMPLVGEIAHRITDTLKPLAGSTIDGDKKRGLPLAQDELDRQAVYIDRYLDTGQLNLAFGLMREWVVNRVALAGEEKTKWLKHTKGRQPIEHHLGGLRAVRANRQDPVRDNLSDPQQQWARLWDDLCQVRNTLQHHGMRPEPFKPENKATKRLLQCWENLKSNTWSLPPSFGGGKGKLLICPIGLTPGVLYSALKNTTPDRVIVICSEQSESNIEEAIAHAGSQAESKTLLLRNTYTGIDEFAGLIAEVSLWLFEADEILANLTGGTSLMGVLVSQLAQRASREYQRPMREFVLIDKRPPEEQRNDPWQLGEIHYLDGEPANDAADGQDGADTSEETD